jgi:hypothetical protein
MDTFKRMDHKDEYGRPMSEPVPFTLLRSEWWLIRNQLRNMADDWQRTQHPDMASKCNALADKVDQGVLAGPDRQP